MATITSHIKSGLLAFGAILVVFHLIMFLFTGWYTVGESEEAVVYTRGEAVQTITQPGGPNFKLPYPYQTVEKVSKETFSLKFGYTEKGQDAQSTPDSKMITGDENIVFADMVVQWRIIDPYKYRHSVSNVETALYNAASSSLRSVIGSSKIDDALTSGKPEIEAKTKEKLIQQLKKYDMGIEVSVVQLQDVDLPNAEVRNAFTDVTNARETMNTKLNEGQKYSNQHLNEAKGEKDVLISKAEGDKAERINKATGDVAVFNDLYKEYKNNPAITKQRLIYETLEKVLPNAKIYITDEGNGTVKYLPLEGLNSEGKKN